MLGTYPPHGTCHDSSEGPHACMRDLTPLGHLSWGNFNSIILEFRGDMQYVPSKQRLEVRLKSKLWRGLQAMICSIYSLF